MFLESQSEVSSVSSCEALISLLLLLVLLVAAPTPPVLRQCLAPFRIFDGKMLCINQNESWLDHIRSYCRRPSTCIKFLEHQFQRTKFNVLISDLSPRGTVVTKQLPIFESDMWGIVFKTGQHVNPSKSCSNCSLFALFLLEFAVPYAL